MPMNNSSMATTEIKVYLSTNHTIRNGSVRIPQKNLPIIVSPNTIDPYVSYNRHKGSDSSTYPKGISHA